MKILDLYITDICNLNCDYCYVDVVKKESVSFDKESFVKRIDLLSYDAIKFLGGEPLVKWGEIQDIIESVSSQNPDIQFTIITNGVLLTQGKIDVIKNYKNVEILISLHEGSICSIKQKRDILLDLETNISFYIIFDPKDFSDAVRKFFLFFQFGFRNFCFAPEIYADWNSTNLKSLEKILQHLSSVIISHNVSVGGIPKNYLKTMNYACEKFVYNKKGEYKICNRFRSLETKESFSYKEIYDYFDKHIQFKQDPNRWFYVCPVGWYLDNEKSIDEKIMFYKDLNTIFLQFHRKINQNTLNFLTQGISEIRFNLTRQCNIRCNYCYVDFNNDALEFSNATNIIDYLFEQDSREICFSFFGGEPLLQFKLLKKIIKYICNHKKFTSKNVSYKIATNFMLINDEVIGFLLKHDFDIHISFNGTETINNLMRDNSSQIVLKNLHKYKDILDFKRVVILLAFSPEYIKRLKENIQFILSIGFIRINFELIFGKNIVWTQENIQSAVSKIEAIYSQKEFCIENNKFTKGKYLDIDTKGRCNDNSLEFYGNEIDSENKKYFDILLSKI